MDYSPTLCFAGFNSKRRKIQQERREKEQLQQSMSRQSFVCRDKCPSEMLRKNVTTVFLLLQHKGVSIEEELCHDTRNMKKAEILSQQGILCRDKKLKSNTRRLLLHISLCCDIMKNRRQNLCHDIISPIVTLIIATWKAC